MLITYIALLSIALVAGVVLVTCAERFSIGIEFCMSLSGFIVLAFSVIIALVGAGMSFSWFSAEQKANLINREYGTSYTQEDVFFASDVIDTIRHIDRKRIELNGNLIRDEK